MPNSQAQSELIESTYRRAGLDFADTGYFEAHVSVAASTDSPYNASNSRFREREQRWVTP